MKCRYSQAMLDGWHSYLKATQNCRRDTTYKEYCRMFHMANTVFRSLTYARQDREAAERKTRSYFGY